MSPQNILARLLRALAGAAHALAKALERLAAPPRPQAETSAAMQALAERFPGAPEHWLRMIAEKAPQLAEGAPTETSEADGDRGPAPPPLQLGRRPRREPPEVIPEPTPFGPVSATRPWLTGQAPVVHLRPVAQEAPKLAAPLPARPIGRALAVLARRRALAAAAAAGQPEPPPKTDAASHEARSATSADGGAPSTPDAGRQPPDTPAPETRVEPEVRSFRPTGGSWATAENPEPGVEAAGPPAPGSREPPPEAQAGPASEGRAPLTDWPWRPHGPPRKAPGEHQSARAAQPHPPLALPPAAASAPRASEAGFPEAAPAHERAHFAERADDRWPELPAAGDETPVEAPPSDVDRHIREQEEGGWNV